MSEPKRDRPGGRPVFAAWLMAACFVATFLGPIGPAAAQEPLEDLRPEKRLGARGARTGDLTVEAPHARFEDRYQGAAVEHSWTVTNSGSAEVTVEQALAVDGSGLVEMVPLVLAPGEQGLVSLVQPLADELGETAFRYALITDEPGVGRYRFSLSGFVQSAYDPETVELRFPPAGPSPPAGPPRAVAEVGSREVERLEILRAVDPPPYLEVEWSAPGEQPGEPLRIEARLLPSAPLGLLGGRFALATNVARQPLLWVRYAGAVYRELVPAANPVALGAVVAGEEQTTTVEIRRASGGSLSSLEASGDQGAVTASVGPCSQPADDCRALGLRFAPGRPGAVAATVTVRLPGVEELPLRVHGVSVSATTQVRELELGSEGGDGR